MDLWILTLAAAGYGLNRMWLSRVSGGVLRQFLVCWANDVLAGAFMLAWLSLLLGLGGLGRVRQWRWAALFLLICALMWEVAAPVIKPQAVFDLWDFAAYQAGGILYLTVQHVTDRRR